jgi:hypothetical protein
MSPNKNQTFFVVVIVILALVSLMFLVYGLVQRTAAIKQAEIAFKQTARAIQMADENEMLRKRALESEMLAAENARQAKIALDLCEQKQKKK